MPSPSLRLARTGLGDALGRVAGAATGSTPPATSTPTATAATSAAAAVVAAWDGWAPLARLRWQDRSATSEHLSVLLRHRGRYWAVTTMVVARRVPAGVGWTRWEDWLPRHQQQALVRAVTHGTVAVDGSAGELLVRLADLADEHLVGDVARDPWDPWFDDALPYWAGLRLLLDADPQCHPEVADAQLFAAVGGCADIAALVDLRPGAVGHLDD